MPAPERYSSNAGGNMSDEEDEAIAGLKRDAATHDRIADQLEAEARHRRQMAARARFGIEYLRKQRGT